MGAKIEDFKKIENTVPVLEQELGVLLARQNAGEIFSAGDTNRLEELKKIAGPELHNVLIDQKLSSMTENERVDLERRATDERVKQMLGHTQ